MKKKTASKNKVNWSKRRSSLLEWFFAHKRPLPWRRTRDPYKIWISETMLQQTTSTAVIPYYKRFIKRFPTLKCLATAPLTEVLEHWAGLGYYSRARNLHKAAKELIQMKEFPQSHQELLKLPGFGPYTSRAVSSLAFSEKVGVLDGNVIRVLCRQFDLKYEWWRTADRQKLQELVDQLAHSSKVHDINQSLMELGATICTPKSPSCIQCPWLKSCKAYAQDTVLDRPLKRPKRARETWVWKADLIVKNDQLLLIKNDYAPFLQKQWLVPGQAIKKNQAPQKFAFRHSITHHDIYCQIRKLNFYQASGLEKWPPKSEYLWVSLDEVHKHAPTSLLTKALRKIKGKGRRHHVESL